MMRKIPKIIHYCWLSKDPFPKDIQFCMNSWQEKLPDYEFMLWDLTRFNIEKSLWVKQSFEAKKYAFAADFIRLYALYNYGGIYLDMDVQVIKKFDDLLGLPYFVGTEGDGWIEAGIMGSEKNANWLKDCLDYFNKPFINPDGTFDMITLPQVMNKIIENKYIIQVTSKEQIIQNLKSDSKIFYLFEKDFFCPKNMGTGVITQTKNTYAIHHFAMSWISSKRKILPNLKRKLIKMFGEKFILKIIRFVK